MSKLFELKNPAFFKSAGKLMLPIILQQAITVGINFLDNIMIGGLGENAITAASFSNQFYAIFQFICMGLGSGAVVLSAQFWGKKDKVSLKNSASIAMQVTFVLCAIFTLMAVIAPAGILRIFTNNAAVIQEGKSYMRLLGTTFVFSGLGSTATYMLRSTGKVNVPLAGSGIAFVVNIFFNWVFIFGKFGAPKLDLLGAAVGTFIARFVEVVIIFGYFVVKDQNIGFRFKNFFSKGGGLWKKYFTYALPVLISDTLLGISLAFTGGIIVGHVSAEMSAGTAIINSLVQVITIVNYGIGGSAAILVGNKIGEGDIEGAKRYGNTYILMSVLFGLIMIPLLWAVKDLYFGFYNINAETIEVATGALLCNCLFLPIQTMAFCISKGILRGGGDSKFLLLADSTMVWFVSIPLGALAALVWHMSPFWIYFFLRMEYPLKGLICLVRYCTGKWIKRI